MFSFLQPYRYGATLRLIDGYPYRLMMSEAVHQTTFTVTHTNVDGTRSGILITSGNKQLITPNILLYTRHGSVPHITQDLLQDTNNSIIGSINGLHLSLSDIIALQPPKSYYTQPNNNTSATNTLHSYLQLQQYIFYFSLYDNILYDNTLVNDSGVTINSIQGKHKITSNEYHTCINKFQPELICSMNDSLDTYKYNNTSVYSKNRIRKCIERNIQWLEQCADSAAADDTYKPLITINLSHLQFLSDDTQSIYYNEIQSRDTLYHGIVLPPLYQPYKQTQTQQHSMIHKFDSSKLRIQQCSGSVLDVLYSVYNGCDLIQSNYSYTCTQLGYASTFIYQPNDKYRPDKLNMHDKLYESDSAPLLDNCSCYACTHHTRSYIHHLLNVHELVAEILLQIHNTHHYVLFIQTVQHHVQNNTYQQYFNDMLNLYQPRSQ